MNYKVLAISAVGGIGVIAVGLMEAQNTPPSDQVEHLAAVDAAEYASASLSDAPAPPSMTANYPSRMPPAEAIAPELATSDSSQRVRVPDVISDSLGIPAAEIPVGLPQIAYVFTYGFRLAGSEIPALQQRHADLCENKGPLVCRIIALNQATDQGEYIGGTLQLAVASDEARTFGKQLTTLAESADGEQVSAAIAGEDLSKRIVDTEARLRARVVLRDRLMDVLATRRGSVTELVEAERGVAQVNEEIDQARSWLTEMKGRVAFSRLEITYEGVAPVAVSDSGFMSPVRGAVGSLGSIFGALVAMLIVLGALGLPLLAAVLGARRAWQRFAPQPVEAAI